MYDPNDVVEIEVEGFGKLKSRLLTERQVRDIKRLTSEARAKGDMLERMELLNQALAIGLVDFDPQDLTLVQKFNLADDYPWAVTMGEMKRLGEASASQSA